ncbi:MAG: site-2 protease family protein [Candidatus Marsarchaeota archaeon]|jgi:Zn-dependent protease|nr:site-2 protease family protein [Candidatus Marsarchaeota archaeon]MCL5418631.1 site-2 protease family protein [Candidatus Marsarchaeota archaeon]
MASMSPKIGKIMGIDIQLHWSFLLLLVLFLVLSPYLFLIWVLLFVCVLIHELAHSVNAKRNNIEVKKIVLYPFGGGSIIDFEKVKPETEFRISIVGPLVSLLLGALFGIAAAYAPSGMIRYTIQLLFILNIFLGVFNLLPWLPLDGGRALRSHMQEHSDYYTATRKSVRVSNAITGAFIVGTLIYVFFISGSFFYKEFIVLWDVVIAIFIYNGAQQELITAFVKTHITKLHVYNAMTKNFMLVKPTTSISELYELMLKQHMHIAVYESNGKAYLVQNVQRQSPRTMAKVAGGTVASIGIEIPEVSYYDKLYNAVEKMQLNESGIAAVKKGSTLAGLLLMQHADTIINLYMSRIHAKMDDSAQKAAQASH